MPPLWQNPFTQLTLQHWLLLVHAVPFPLHCPATWQVPPTHENPVQQVSEPPHIEPPGWQLPPPPGGGPCEELGTRKKKNQRKAMSTETANTYSALQLKRQWWGWCWDMRRNHSIVAQNCLSGTVGSIDKIEEYDGIVTSLPREPEKIFNFHVPRKSPTPDP